MFSKASALATVLLATTAFAKTDLSGCTSTAVGASLQWYVPDTGEICSILDCGGGRAPPKTTVPGCAAYSGTETYSPSYLPGWGPNGASAKPTAPSGSPPSSAPVSPTPSVSSSPSPSASPSATSTAHVESSAKPDSTAPSSAPSKPAAVSSKADVSSGLVTASATLRTTAAATTNAKASTSAKPSGAVFTGAASPANVGKGALGLAAIAGLAML